MEPEPRLHPPSEEPCLHLPAHLVADRERVELSAGKAEGLAELDVREMRLGWEGVAKMVWYTLIRSI